MTGRGSGGAQFPTVSPEGFLSRYGGKVDEQIETHHSSRMPAGYDGNGWQPVAGQERGGPGVNRREYDSV